MTAANKNVSRRPKLILKHSPKTMKNNIVKKKKKH